MNPTEALGKSFVMNIQNSDFWPAFYKNITWIWLVLSFIIRSSTPVNEIWKKKPDFLTEHKKSVVGSKSFAK